MSSALCHVDDACVAFTTAGDASAAASHLSVDEMKSLESGSLAGARDESAAAASQASVDEVKSLVLRAEEAHTRQLHALEAAVSELMRELLRIHDVPPPAPLKSEPPPPLVPTPPTMPFSAQLADGGRCAPDVEAPQPHRATIQGGDERCAPRSPMAAAWSGSAMSGSVPVFPPDRRSVDVASVGASSQHSSRDEPARSWGARIKVSSKSLVAPWKSLTFVQRISDRVLPDDFDDLTASEIIGRLSPFAYWTLFLGGFAVIRNWRLQVVYSTLFLVCNFACLAVCASNLYARVPPYTSSPLDFLTVYIHIVALHTWLSWRKFLWEPHMVSLLTFARDATELRQQIVWFARALLVAQVVAVLWGYAALPLPATVFAMSGDHAMSSTSAFALFHALQMYLVIPGHIPTLMAGYGLFMFMCRLHALDARRVEALANDACCDRRCKDENFAPIANASGEAIHKAQARLSTSCSKWGLLMVHQAAYMFLQLVFTLMEFHDKLPELLDPDSPGPHTDWSGVRHHLVYAGWHLVLGLVAFVVVLVTPAATTAVFAGTVHNVYRGLRARGSSERVAVQTASDIAFHVDGFKVLAVKVSFRALGLVISVVVTTSTLLLRLQT